MYNINEDGYVHIYTHISHIFNLNGKIHMYSFVSEIFPLIYLTSSSNSTCPKAKLSVFDYMREYVPFSLPSSHP